MFIIMKRLPNTQDISQMASLLQQRHSHITVIISENPSGGLYQDTMYKLASQTNGLCFFEEDEMFGEVGFSQECAYYSYFRQVTGYRQSGRCSSCTLSMLKFLELDQSVSHLLMLHSMAITTLE